MAAAFDPYYVWLGIPPKDQPPNFYRLLGVELFEAHLDVIDNAADRQMAHLQRYAAGQHADLSQQLLNEVSAARVCLLDPTSKTRYDEELRARLAPPTPSDPLEPEFPALETPDFAANNSPRERRSRDKKRPATVKSRPAAPPVPPPQLLETPTTEPRPLWRQPKALAGAGGLLALVAIAATLLTRNDPGAGVAEASSQSAEQATDEKDEEQNLDEPEVTEESDRLAEAERAAAEQARRREEGEQVRLWEQARRQALAEEARLRALAEEARLQALREEARRGKEAGEAAAKKAEATRQDPFRELASPLTLPPMDGGDSPVVLGKVYIDAEEAVFVGLLGSDVVLGKTGKFNVLTPTNNGQSRQWTLQLVGISATVDVAELVIKDEQLWFAWKKLELSERQDAEKLRNCTLEISAGPRPYRVALRQPVFTDPIFVQLDKPTSLKFHVPGLPRDEALQLEIREEMLSGSFPGVRIEPATTVGLKETIHLAFPIPPEYVRDGGATRPMFVIAVTMQRQGDNVTLVVQARMPSAKKEGSLAAFKKKDLETMIAGVRTAKASRENEIERLEQAYYDAGYDESRVIRARLSVARRSLEELETAANVVSRLTALIRDLDKNARVGFKIYGKFGDEQLELVTTANLVAPAAAHPARAAAAK